jgi:hypothetical protein
VVRSQPRQIVHRPYLEKNQHKKVLVEWFKVKAPSSSLSIQKKTKQKTQVFLKITSLTDLAKARSVITASHLGPLSAWCHVCLYYQGFVLHAHSWSELSPFMILLLSLGLTQSRLGSKIKLANIFQQLLYAKCSPKISTGK